jgi:uncharacterized protein (DUF1919 family)
LIHPLIEEKDLYLGYPIGRGVHGELIHFMHYDSFTSAVYSWNKRKERMDFSNLGIMLTNFPRNGDIELLKRFEQLPFRNRVAFVEKGMEECEHTFCIKGYWGSRGGGRNLYATQYINGKRYIDQFDYVEFINNLENTNE